MCPSVPLHDSFAIDHQGVCPQDEFADRNIIMHKGLQALKFITLL